METRNTTHDRIVDARCNGCRAPIARGLMERAGDGCAVCDERDDPRREVTTRRWRPGEPASDLRVLARWLPAMDARSPALARIGWSGHSGASSNAWGGRLDHVDERSAEFGRAVAVWQHLRGMIERGDGEAVALLWTAWTLAPVVDDPQRDLRARGEAVALGAAPRALRLDWRARGHEVDRTRVVAAPHTVVVGREADGVPVLREVVMRSTAIVSTRGPTFRALAQAWGAEALRMLWAPTGVPGDVAERAALGWAGEDARAAWEATRGSVRDRVVAAWADGAMQGARARYRAG